MVGLSRGTKQVARKIAGAARERTVRVLRRSSVAVLVDAENIPAKYFPQVIESMRQLGHVRDVRIYGPIALLNSEAWSVIAVAYGAKRVPCVGCRGRKNSSDIRMVVDAMDLMASKRVVTFALVSDDADFAPLARRLREEGRHVIGVGRMGHGNQYRKAFDEYVALGGGSTVVDESSEMAAMSPRTIEKISRECGIDSRTLALAVTCARRGAGSDSWCPMSTFGTFFRAAQPSFSVKRYGCKNLTAFVAKTGLFDMEGSRESARIRIRAA